MIIDEIIILLNQLKLKGMVDALQHYLDNPDSCVYSLEEFLKYLLEAELTDKENRRLRRNFSAAKLRESAASTEKVDYVDGRGLKAEEVNSLALCYWIRKFQHLILTGLTGTGKTWLA